MSDIAIIDAVVALQPYDVPKDSRVRQGAVAVFRKGDARLSDYGMSWPVALSQNAGAQLSSLLMLYRHLTAYFGVCPTDVDDAFMTIPEYRAAVLD